MLKVKKHYSKHLTVVFFVVASFCTAFNLSCSGVVSLQCSLAATAIVLKIDPYLQLLNQY